MKGIRRSVEHPARWSLTPIPGSRFSSASLFHSRIGTLQSGRKDRLKGQTESELEKGRREDRKRGNAKMEEMGQEDSEE